MDKLIITVSIAPSLMYPNLYNWPQTDEELIEEVVKCYDAGAAIAHIHLPKGKERDAIDQIRDQCDIIIQSGSSSAPISLREDCFMSKPDMMSVNLNHQAEHFNEKAVDVLHPLEELKEYCIKLKEFQIKPVWGVWHFGSFWNLNYLIDNGFLDGLSAHFLSYFFDWPGGSWSPAHYDIYMHRKQYMPENCIHSVSVFGEEQMKLLVFVLTHGGHIRVGTEDYPFLEKGKPAKNNAEIVHQYIEISEHVGRKIATPSEARKILGL